MGQCFVITSGKGGVGKTTISTNLGVCLAQKGHRVVLVDADIGLRNLDLTLGMETDIHYDLVQVIEGECTLEDALMQTKHSPNLYLLAAAQDRDKMAVSTYDMKELVSCLKESFDYVLIDCPAGIEQGFKNALAGADQAIVVATPEISSIRDADRAIALMEKQRRNLAPQLIINRYNPALVERGEMLDVDDIWNILGIPILGVLPETEDVLIASNRGIPVVLHSKHEIASAFERSARRLIGEEIPLHDLHSSTSLWKWIKGLVSTSRQAAI